MKQNYTNVRYETIKMKHIWKKFSKITNWIQINRVLIVVGRRSGLLTTNEGIWFFCYWVRLQHVLNNSINTTSFKLEVEVQCSVINSLDSLMSCSVLPSMSSSTYCFWSISPFQKLCIFTIEIMMRVNSIRIKTVKK